MTATDLLRRDEADALVRDAHLNVHRHPPGFPGFRARVRLSTEGAVSVGRAAFRAGAAPAITVGARPEDADWLAREAASMVAHRAHRAYEDGDGRFDKDVEEGEGPFGRVVHLADPMLSTYWIENGHITRIGRTIEGGRLSIMIQDQAPAPDGRWVPSHFTVTVQDETSGEVVAAEAYRDRYVAFGDLLLPASRRVVSLGREGSRTRELLLEHHELLAAGEAAA